MLSPSEYTGQIHSLGLAGRKFEWSNSKEAKATLSECRMLQKKLRLIKKGVNADIREIRAHYRGKAPSAGSGVSGVLSIFGKRSAAGKWRADSKRALAAERDDRISPYSNLKMTIDDWIHELDGAKLACEEFIEEEKSKAPVASEGGAAGFCTGCGKKVGKTDKFCRHCGAKQ